MTPVRPPLLDEGGNPINEQIEANINKRILIYASSIIFLLISIIGWVTTTTATGILDKVNGIEANTLEMKTYIQTNDRDKTYYQKQLNDLSEKNKLLEERVKDLESSRAAFWKDYGWFFNVKRP